MAVELKKNRKIMKALRENLEQNKYLNDLLCCTDQIEINKIILCDICTLRYLHIYINTYITDTVYP